MKSLPIPTNSIKPPSFKPAESAIIKFMTKVFWINTPSDTLVHKTKNNAPDESKHAELPTTQPMVGKYQSKKQYEHFNNKNKARAQREDFLPIDEVNRKKEENKEGLTKDNLVRSLADEAVTTSTSGDARSRSWFAASKDAGVAWKDSLAVVPAFSAQDIAIRDIFEDPEKTGPAKKQIYKGTKHRRATLSSKATLGSDISVTGEPKSGQAFTSGLTPETNNQEHQRLELQNNTSFKTLGDYGFNTGSLENISPDTQITAYAPWNSGEYFGTNIGLLKKNEDGWSYVINKKYSDWKRGVVSLNKDNNNLYVFFKYGGVYLNSDGTIQSFRNNEPSLSKRITDKNFQNELPKGEKKDLSVEKAIWQTLINLAKKPLDSSYTVKDLGVNPLGISDDTEISGMVRIENQVYIGTKDGLIVYNRDLKMWAWVFKDPSLKDVKINKLIGDVLGNNIFVDTEQGQFIVNKDFTQKLPPCPVKINDVFMHGIVIVGTDNGIYYYDGGRWSHDEGIKGMKIDKLVSGQDGRLKAKGIGKEWKLN